LKTEAKKTPNKNNRIAALGNSIVPQIAEKLFLQLKKSGFL